jgi:uncharacterized membrane protein
MDDQPATRRRGRRGAIGVAVALLVALAGATGAAAQSLVPCRYEVAHVIQAPFVPGFGYPVTAGAAISPSGRYVCGYYQIISTRFAFLYDTQTQQFLTLPVPAGSFTWASDVNEQYVVGAAEENGFLYHIASGQVTYLPPGVPADGTCTINAINSSNVVCGTRTIQASPERSSAFIWSAKEGFADLGLINGQSTSATNDNSDVLGRMVVDGVGKPFLWRSGTLVELPTPGGYSVTPTRLNRTGSVTGRMGLGTFGVVRAFRGSSQGAITLVPLPGHDRGSGNGISDDGVVAGTSNNADLTDQRAVIWGAAAARDVNSLIPPGSATHLRSAQRFDLNARLLANGYSGLYAVAMILEPTFASAADITGDCKVNVNDLLAVINQWGPCPPMQQCPADIAPHPGGAA